MSFINAGNVVAGRLLVFGGPPAPVVPVEANACTYVNDASMALYVTEEIASLRAFSSGFDSGYS